jgi:hypothetical protein
MELKKLGKKERWVLLDYLGFDHPYLKCQVCGEKVDYETCSIMPPMNTKEKATILCGDSPLCFATYFTWIEDFKKLKEKKGDS